MPGERKKGRSRVEYYKRYNEERRQTRAAMLAAKRDAAAAAAAVPAAKVETKGASLAPGDAAAVLDMPAAGAPPRKTVAELPKELLAEDPAPAPPARVAAGAAEVAVAPPPAAAAAPPPPVGQAPAPMPTAALGGGAAAVAAGGMGLCYRHAHHQTPCAEPECTRHGWTPPTEEEAKLSGRVFLAVAARFVKRVPESIDDAEAIPAGYAFLELLDEMGLRGRKSTIYMTGAGATWGYVGRCQPRTPNLPAGVQAAPRVEKKEDAPAPREAAAAGAAPAAETVVHPAEPGRRAIVEIRSRAV